MSDTKLAGLIRARKAELDRELVILGHHYQQDEVIQFADFTGDSFKLSQLAAHRVVEIGARYVVFCGVHFMAESADILTPETTSVILPDLSAGCSMADMADHDEASDAWDRIHAALAASRVRLIPVCYMNSSARIKAFCGEHGGAVCTSSNCQRVFQWALAGGTIPAEPHERIKILFLPDEHLGRNTAASMGFDVTGDMCVWDPKHTGELGGVDEATLDSATFILWKGHCSVHKLFRPEHVDQIRAQWPDVKVIVHPECCYPVVQKADISASTEGIAAAIRNAEPHTRWSVGTEVHMVSRLARQAAKRQVTVRMLSDCQCLCTTMYRIDMPHLLWTLDHLVRHEPANVIKVGPQVKHFALVALDRMLALTGSGTFKQAQAAGGEVLSGEAEEGRESRVGRQSTVES